MANQIKFNVGFQVDRSGLNELQSALAQVQIAASKATGMDDMSKKLREAGKAASQLSDILNQSWNNKLGQLDLSKVNNGIKEAYGNVSNLKATMISSGPAGAAAYNQVASAILNTNLQLKQSNKLLDEMATSMANTVKWGITSSIFNNISSSIQQAYGYTKKLDSSLNDIRIVTDKSAESMEKFAKQANNAAKDLGASTLDYTDASLIYYQQGLNDDEVAARAETTLKAANVTGQTGEEVSEQLTAVWNGYKVTAQEAELYVDKLAAVAATTASDLEELSTGMSKVASAANAMGVDVDQLNAQLATIVSVTRQAPESVGTALKTIYARMSDLKLGETDEDGLGLGDVSGAMEKMGISIMDETGNLRDMGIVIEEVAAKWDTWSEAQKTAMAQVMAGKRQYNNLVALFENWDMYTDALNTSTDAAGTLQKQQDIYMESTEAHLQQLRTEAEETYDILFDQNIVNGFTDALTGALGALNTFLDGIGGGAQAFLALGAIATNVFSKQIGTALGRQVQNIQATRDNADAAKIKEQIITANKAEGNGISDDEALQSQIDNTQKILSVSKQLSQEEHNRLIELQKQIGLNKQQLANVEKFKTVAKKVLDINEDEEALFSDLVEDSQIRVKQTTEQLKKEQEILDIIKEQSLFDTPEDATEAEQVLQNIMKRYDYTEQTQITEEVILDLQQKLTKETQEWQKNVEEVEGAMKNVANLTDDQIVDIQEQTDAMQGLVNQEIDTKTGEQAFASLIESATAWVAVGTSAVGVYQTLTDESLTAGEKIQQVVTVLLTMLPMLVTAIKSIGTVGEDAGIVMTKLAMSMGALPTGTSATTVGFTGATAAVLGFQTALGPLWLVLAAIAAILGTVAIIAYTTAKAWNADAEAAEKAAEASQKAAEAAETAKQAYEDLKNTISGYEDAVKAMEELTEGTQEYEEALRAANEKALELMKNNPELAEKSYREDGLIKFQDGALESYEKTTYEKSDKATGRSYVAKAKADETQFESDVTNFRRKLDSETDANGWSNEQLKDIFDDIAEHDFTLNFDLIDKYGIEMTKAMDKLGDEFIALAKTAKQLEEANKRLYEESMRISLEDVGAFKEGEDGDSQAVKDAITSLYTQGFDDDARKSLEQKAEKEFGDAGFGDDKNLHKEYARIMGYDYLGDKSGKGSFLVDGKSTEIDDEQILEVVKQNYVQENMASYDKETREDISKAVREMAEVAQNLAEGNQQLNDTLETELLGFLSGEDKKFDFTSLSPEQVENLKQQFESGVFNNIDFSNTAYQNAEQFAYALNAALSTYDASAYWNNQAEQAKTAFTSITDALSVLQTGEELSDEQITYLETLEEKYAELGAIKIRDSEAYLRLLEQIQDLEEENYTKSLEQTLELNKEKYQEAIDKRNNDEGEVVRRYNGSELEEKVVVDVVANMDAVTEAMEDVFDTKYEIEVSITNDLISDVDNIVNKSGKLADAIDKIGDGFKLAADDAESILDVFPELALGAEVLADGTIQLSNTTTDAVLGDYAAQIDADTNKTEVSLQNRITELEAARAQVLKEIEFLETEADTEEEIQASVDKINQLSAEFQTGLSEATTNDEVANSAASAEAVIDNWAAKEEAAMAYAETAAEAESEDHQISSEAPRVPGAKGKVKSTATTQNTTKDVDRTEADALEDQRQAAINGAKSLVESYTGQIADLTLALSKLRKGAQGIDDAANDVGKDDSSSKQEERNAEYKNADEEIDRYWELNKAIEQVTEALSDLDKKQEKLYGRELINSLKQENELLAQQAQAYENLAAEQQKEAAELRGTLSAYGVVFDAQGGVTNYLAASQAALEQYNAAVAAYNAFLIDEATFQAAERAYENFKAQLDRYETLYYDEMVDTQNQLDDIRTKTLENNLKAWETELQIRLDLHEAERDWNDFLNEINEDFKSVFKDLGKDLNTMLENATEYADLNGNMIVEEGQNSIPFAGTLGVDIAAMQDVMGEIDKLKNGGTSDMFSSMSEAQEKLKELMNQTMEDTKALQDLYQEAWETYMEGIDQSAEKFEDLMGKFSLIDDELAYQGELIELLYGEEAYGLMNKLYDTQAKNGLEQIKSLQQQKDMWYELWQNAEEGSEEQKKYYELWTQAQGDLNDKVTEYIKLLKDDYANTLDGILSKLDKDLTGGLGMEKLKEQWEDAKEEAEKYLNETEEVYAIQTLYNKYTDSISNASLKSQQKLQDLRDKELATLRKKDKLTQYDIDRAEAKYQIALKEIALEDAQNAKNSMKLTRGTDGNWSYQYVADEDNMLNKEQELLDAQNQLYELDMEEQMNKVDEYLEKLTEFQEAKEELYRQLANTTDEIERQRILDEITRLEDEYYPKLEELASEYEIVNQNLAASSAGVMLTAINQNKENFKSLTSEQQGLIDTLVNTGIADYADLEGKVKNNYNGIGDQAGTVLSTISTAWSTAAEDMINQWNADDGSSVKEQMKAAHDAIIEASDEYVEKVDEAREVVGEDWSEDGIAGAIGEAEAATDSLSEATEDLVSETESNLADYKAAVEEIEEIWYAVKDAIEEALEAAREYANLEPPEAPTYTPPTVPTTPGSTGTGTGTGSGSGNSSSSSSNSSSTAKSYTVYHKSGNGDQAVYYISPTPSGVTVSGSYSTIKASANTLRRQGHSVSSGVAGKTFKTGGYTGSWADGNPEVDNGKLAWLHQKELVLNAKDTENILDAVQTIRNLSNLSSSIEDMIMRNLSSMIIKMANLGTNVNYSTENSEQPNNNTFNITAEFPNANDVTSIREAILSLPNIASQYVHENRK